MTGVGRISRTTRSLVGGQQDAERTEGRRLAAAADIAMSIIAAALGRSIRRVGGGSRAAGFVAGRLALVAMLLLEAPPLAHRSRRSERTAAARW